MVILVLKQGICNFSAGVFRRFGNAYFLHGFDEFAHKIIFLIGN